MASHPQHQIDRVLGEIEESILPSLSMMLDTLLDAGSLAQPGFDAEAHAAELRSMTGHLEVLTRLMEAVSSPLAAAPPHSEASAA